MISSLLRYRVWRYDIQPGQLSKTYAVDLLQRKSLSESNTNSSVPYFQHAAVFMILIISKSC